MKDGRFENADELRVWLNRPPATLCAFCGLAIDAANPVSHDGRPVHFACVLDTSIRDSHDPDCPKCHGAGHYIEECKTPGWRMVDCEYSK